MDAERSYIQTLERLGKLIVHPTPCFGYRTCDISKDYTSCRTMADGTIKCGLKVRFLSPNLLVRTFSPKP